MKNKNKTLPSSSTLNLLRQICNFIPEFLVPKLARETGVDKKARTFNPWSHVVCLLYAQLTHSIGLNDVCDALNLHSGPLSSLRGASPPSRNNLSNSSKVRSATMAQRLFWALVPDPRFVADPKTGSRHNRGNAVDVTLVDAKGRELDMPTGFDDFSPRAGHGETRLPARVIENRRLLAETMEKTGFRRLQSEWWHYDDNDGNGDILDVPFDELCR